MASSSASLSFRTFKHSVFAAWMACTTRLSSQKCRFLIRNRIVSNIWGVIALLWLLSMELVMLHSRSTADVTFQQSKQNFHFSSETVSIHYNFHFSTFDMPFSTLSRILAVSFAHLPLWCWLSSPLPRPAQGIMTGHEPKHTGISDGNGGGQMCESPSICCKSHSLCQRFQPTAIQQSRRWFKNFSLLPILVTDLSFE